MVLQYGLMQVSTEFSVSHLLKRRQRGSSSGRDGKRKERQLKTERETNTNMTTGGSGELGWKDSREQSEINLDTPDGMKFVCVPMRTHVYTPFCNWQLVRFSLCIEISSLCVYGFLWILGYLTPMRTSVFLRWELF